MYDIEVFYSSKSQTISTRERLVNCYVPENYVYEQLHNILAFRRGFINDSFMGPGSTRVIGDCLVGDLLDVNDITRTFLI